MAGGSNGYRAALVRRQLTPGLTSSFPGTAGLPPFISFSTSYPELDFAALRQRQFLSNLRWSGQLFPRAFRRQAGACSLHVTTLTLLQSLQSVNKYLAYV